MNTSFMRTALSACLAAFCLMACSSGSLTPSGSNNAPATPQQPPAAAAPPPLIAGDETVLVSNILARITDKPVAAADISNGFLLTRLLVLLTPTTTVAQLNAAARAVGATAITSSEANSLAVVLAIPHQTDVAAAQGVAKTMRGQAGIAFAWPGQMARTSVLPELSPGLPVSPLGLSHLLGSRFPQAWNARNAAPADCLPRSVNVYVFDFFGDVGSRPEFLSQVPAGDFVFDPEGVATGLPAHGLGHGYDVALTLAAKFDADTPTGADPFSDCVLIHQREAGGLEFISAVRGLLFTIANDADPRVILTVSLNFVDDGFCGANGDQVCDAQSVGPGADFIHNALLARAIVASAWAAISKNLDLQDKMLVTQSVGNIDPDDPDGSFLAKNYLGFRSASFSSAAALATHLSDLQALLTDTALWSGSQPGLPDLTFDAAGAAQFVQQVKNEDGADSIGAGNLLLVDSGTNAAVLSDIKQSDFDFLGADVRAVGQDVVSSDGQLLKGTSFSAPTVAGLAAYLWNLSPALIAQSPAATAALIRDTSVTTANSPTVPVIDAYAATLKLDTVTGCCSGALFAPIRLGLVDFDGDGRFTSADLQKFADALGLGSAGGPSIPTDPDYSRFDLNGDGFTGGILIAPFSLDAAVDSNGNTKIASVSEDIEGFPVSFNEAALSDVQILCYYAYSLLYEAETAGGTDNPKRRQILGADKCIGLQLDVAITQNIPSDGTGALTINLKQPAAAGQLAPAAGVPYQLSVTGGTAAPSSGVTDAQGAASATVTPSGSATSVQVRATAVSASTGAVLAQGVANASVIPPESSSTTYVGTYTNSCSGLVFPGQTPPSPVITTGSASAQLEVDDGEARFAQISGDDTFFKTGQIAQLGGPPEDFSGFIDPHNGFTWLVTGSRGSTHLNISVNEVGNNCTFVFDGTATP
jgi:hypothetical protein